MKNFSLPPDTHIGHVHLQVSDLDQTRAFYADLLGFKPVQLVNERPAGSSTRSAPAKSPAHGNTHDDHHPSRRLALSASAAPPIHLLFTERLDARPKPPRTTGLYHIAIRFPDRRSLALVFQRLINHNWPFQGFSDHKVSEALYLADPESNGLELYVDRPRDQWPREAGQIAMTTERLDVEDLLKEAEKAPAQWTGINPGTDIGHIHLQVSDLSQAEAFYHDLVGLDVTQRSYPGALFFSAGGYHHHVGTNIWAGRGAPPPPEDAVGLLSYSLQIRDPHSWQSLITRLQESDIKVESLQTYNGTLAALVHDPFHIGLEITTDESLVDADTLTKLRAANS